VAAMPTASGMLLAGQRDTMRLSSDLPNIFASSNTCNAS